MAFVDVHRATQDLLEYRKHHPRHLFTASIPSENLDQCILHIFSTLSPSFFHLILVICISSFNWPLIISSREGLTTVSATVTPSSFTHYTIKISIKIMRKNMKMIKQQLLVKSVNWHIMTALILGILNSFAPSAESAEQPQSKPDDDWTKTFFTDYIHEKLEIGTRFSYRYLTNADSGHQGGTYGSGTYLGTIYGLDEEQDYLPNKFFLAYYFNHYLGLELAYDSIEAETVAWNTSTGSKKTDGNVTLSGPTVSLIAKYPNTTRFTPYLGLGLGFFSGDFDRDSAWAYSDWGTSDRNRYMIVDDVTALFVNAGFIWKFNQNWYIDTSLQYLHADPDATFYGYTDDVCDTVQTGHFPLDNVSLRLGIGYSF
jgi:opacity protein-like surface antigen